MYVMTPKIFEKLQKKIGRAGYDLTLLPLSLSSLFSYLPLEVGPLKSS